MSLPLTLFVFLHWDFTEWIMFLIMGVKEDGWGVDTGLYISTVYRMVFV